ncbi:DUF3040 domain-containing protein [aff. Roholtiella sp. LEGE 12411]|uniref:DUF3040 domain-containing protein n=1 Tax=aff. Roholtiella sp. LEGE 12411 TaxID=1828822 RepID=UPI00187EDF1D|nr:DUF3040 domain-containing protein [aff. Roholtiella sp. LEGE 12411]MBE9038220.1 DUF3040 domain-containing protein [aff. Roholtiella sp. LEGE 12411]
MTSQDDRHKELERRERTLREREMEVRLREMEADIRASNAPFHKTVKHQPENSSKLWIKKAILGGKLFALGVAVLIAVRIASVMAGIIIVAALTWISYKLFFESPKNKP